jgi:tetratricopeptide (TPR) repeat protein
VPFRLLQGIAEVLARQPDDRVPLVSVLALLAAVCRMQGDLDGAIAAGRQALALAHGLGMRPHLAHCHLDLEKFYLKIGRQEEAHAELSAAIELYRTMVF